MNLYGLMYILLVGVTHYIIPPFSMFRDVRKLENFPMGENKYNYMDNITNIVDRDSKRGGGWYK